MILLVILAAALLALFAACFAIVRLGERERIGAADVVVVLGCKVHGDGAPSQMLAGRLERALGLWRDGRTPVVIVSGDGAAKEGVDEAAVMKAWLVERGLPAAAVIEDGGGVDTRATARFTSAWMKQAGATSVLAVSSYFHLPRIRLALRQAGLRRIFSAHACPFRPRDWRWIVREVAAYVKYLLRL